jgi:hypothetical protein
VCWLIRVWRGGYTVLCWSMDPVTEQGWAQEMVYGFGHHIGVCVALTLNSRGVGGGITTATGKL